jgi:hypothetical protein
MELARISHQFSTAAADTGMSTALRSVGLLDVLSSTPAGPSRRAPCIHARLHRLATRPGEKSGLGDERHSQVSVCYTSSMTTNLGLSRLRWCCAPNKRWSSEAVVVSESCVGMSQVGESVLALD